MSDHREIVLFNRGTPLERRVEFNADAPTRTQANAAEVYRGVVLSSAGLACGMLWIVSAYCSAWFAGSYGASMGEALIWMAAATAASLIKVGLPLAIKSSHDRGEVAAAMAGGLLVGVAALFGLIATASYLYQALALHQAAGLFGAFASAIICMALAAGIETLAILSPFTFVTSAKAHQETYERPAEARGEAVAFEPAAGSFEAGFTRWAAESLTQDTSGRLRGPDARAAFEKWALYNGPYLMPSKETFGRTLASHMAALGAVPTKGNGQAAYSGVRLAEAPASLEYQPAVVMK